MPTRRPRKKQDNGAASQALPAGQLADTMNLGPKSAAVLARAGVTSLDEVKKLGSVKVFSLAKRVEPSVTLNLLWALEGAVLCQPWRQVAKEHRASLLLALEDCERHTQAR